MNAVLGKVLKMIRSFCSNVVASLRRALVDALVQTSQLDKHLHLVKVGQLVYFGTSMYGYLYNYIYQRIIKDTSPKASKEEGR